MTSHQRTPEAVLNAPAPNVVNIAPVTGPNRALRRKRGARRAFKWIDPVNNTPHRVDPLPVEPPQVDR